MSEGNKSVNLNRSHIDSQGQMTTVEYVRAFSFKPAYPQKKMLCLKTKIIWGISMGAGDGK